MVNNYKLYILLVLVLFLFGCASGAKMEKMIYIGTQQNYDSALKNSVSVAAADGGDSTNPMWVSKISNEAFTGAVKKTLADQGLISESGRYQLKIQFIKLDQPLFGFDMTVTSHINYKLVDTKSNTTIMDETVVAPFTATVSDAFVGSTRLQIANEGSGRKNIEGLLNKLSELKINKEDVAIKDVSVVN